MKFKFRRIPFLCILFSLVFLVPNFLPFHLAFLDNTGLMNEKFNPALVNQIRSIDDLLANADSVAFSKNIKTHSVAYVSVLSELVKQRFHHNYSYYSLQENWIAAVMGATVWSHLSAIVLPDDILKYPMAACSQQSIVMMTCLRRKGISYRKIGFAHHFALEAEIDGDWYYIDTDVEPDFSKIPQSSIATLIQTKALYEIYKERLTPPQVDFIFAHQFYGKPNESPAPQASIFHHVTKILSKTLFLIPLLFLYRYLKKFNERVSINKTVIGKFATVEQRSI